MLRENFLEQNAFCIEDASCSPSKQMGLMTAHIHFYERVQHVLKSGKNLDDILELPLREELASLKKHKDEDFETALAKFHENLDRYLPR